MSKSTNHVDVKLRPFKHQVGGHTCVLEISGTAICKPFTTKEAWFYKHVLDGLKDFIPKYLGETYVKCNIESDRKCLVASVPNEILNTDFRGNLQQDQTSIVSNEPQKKRRRKSKECCDADDSMLEAWSTTCIDRQINRYGFWANNQPQRFLILENLVHKYERPCMMDLKMGRRQYGDDSCDEKRKLLEKRCARTTSVTLGFRICGSQVYDVRTGQYVCHNKYHGRKLDDKGAVQELVNFFHDGECVRIEAVQGVLDKLNALKVAMATQKKFLFRAASLLLMYDAAPSRRKGDTFKENSGNNGNALNVDLVNNVPENCSHLVHSEANCSIHNGDNLIPQFSSNCAQTIGEKLPDNKTGSCVNCHSVAGNNEMEVVTDIRLIDFAHVSEITDVDNESTDDETISFGLDKLREIFNDILRRYK
ncbi:inositol hexakisphosphate kinase 3 [Mactra antiquata]